MHCVLQDTYYEEFITFLWLYFMSHLIVKDAKWAQVHTDLFYELHKRNPVITKVIWFAKISSKIIPKTRKKTVK